MIIKRPRRGHRTNGRPRLGQRIITGLESLLDSVDCERPVRAVEIDTATGERQVYLETGRQTRTRHESEPHSSEDAA
jgi:hypothetical protein